MIVIADRSKLVETLGAFRELAHDRAMDLNPVWSPDGKTLAYGVGAYDADVGCLEGL